MKADIFYLSKLDQILVSSKLFQIKQTWFVFAGKQTAKK